MGIQNIMKNNKGNKTILVVKDGKIKAVNIEFIQKNQKKIKTKITEVNKISSKDPISSSDSNIILKIK